VAAAVDYEMINGKRHGELANRIADKIKSERRLAAGVDEPRQHTMPLPTHRTPEQKRQHELEGGVLIVGRQTFKEFMAGLKRGWTDTLENIDKEDELARGLQDDGTFDEPDEPGEDAINVHEKHSLPSPKMSPVYSPLQQMQLNARRPPPAKSSSIPPSINTPPTILPTQPPILFVPFTNYIGFTQIPLMIWDFFNQRHKVKSGAEAAF
jgi:import inner membrane translocase subunit TIM54